MLKGRKEKKDSILKEMEAELAVNIEQREEELLLSLHSLQLSYLKGVSLQKEELEFFLESLNFCQAFLSSFLSSSGSLPSLPSSFLSSSLPFSARLSSLLSSYPSLPPPPQQILKTLSEKKSLSEFLVFQDLFHLLSPKHSTVQKGTLSTKKGIKDEEILLLVLPRDSANQPFKGGSFSDYFQVIFHPPEGIKASSLRTIEGEKEGEFSVIFEPSGTGKVEVRIHLEGIPIQGSPLLFPFLRSSSSIKSPARSFCCKEKGKPKPQSSPFNDPYGMAVGGNDQIFVANRNLHSVLCFSPQGSLLFVFGSYGKGPGQLNQPHDVAYDPKNRRIVVADTFNDRIQIFDLEGTFLTSFGCSGKGKGKFTQPSGVAVDHEGNIYIADSCNHRVQVFDERGNCLLKFGSQGNRKGEFYQPRGINLLSNGDILISEPYSNGNHRLSVFNSKGEFLRFLGKQSLINPQWFFVDSLDQVLVPEDTMHNASLVLFSKEGKEKSRIGQGILDRAYGVTMNQRGEIFLSGVGKDGKDDIFVF